MSDLEIIHRQLKSAQSRRRMFHIWTGLWKGVFAGAIIWVVGLMLFKLVPVPDSVPVYFAAAAGAVLLFFILRGASQPVDLAETARWIDRKENLQERISSALEFSASPIGGNWKDLLVKDAANAVRSLDTRKLIPLHLPTVTRWSVLILAMGVVLGFVPEFRSKNFRDREKEKAVMADVGKNLQEFSKQALAQKPLLPEPMREHLEAIQEIGTQMAATTPTRNEALKDLANAAEKLKQELKELGKENPMKPLSKTAPASSNKSPSAQSKELQRKVDALKEKLGDGTDEKKLDDLKEQLAKARQEAAGLPSNTDSAQASEAKRSLAKSLAQMSKAAREMGLSLPDLEAAIAALESQNPDLLLKNLDLATQDLEKLRDMARELAQASEQLEKIGKDLAEQLNKGQTEAAQASLEKMTQDLKSGKLSKADLEKLMKEVSQAIDPGSKYGKVGELLQKAGSQMKKGEKGEAGQSLAEAAKELEKLAQQMAESESLNEALKALQQAQMAVGNGKKWAECKNPGQGRGGKPGRGVGTHSEDEDGWSYFEMTEGWEHVGEDKRGGPGKGQTDRGDAAENPNMTPDKIRGQFNPGAPMPSITLKGVSIKGTSKVGMQEAVQAAQAEAQSAINQDQVPRAYQGAVKDYFDDLKN